MIYSQTSNIFLILEQNHIRKEINKTDHITSHVPPENVSACKIRMSYTYIFIYCIVFIIQIYNRNKMKKGHSNNAVIGREKILNGSLCTHGWLIDWFLKNNDWVIGYYEEYSYSSALRRPKSIQPR